MLLWANKPLPWRIKSCIWVNRWIPRAYFYSYNLCIYYITVALREVTGVLTLKWKAWQQSSCLLVKMCLDTSFDSCWSSSVVAAVPCAEEDEDWGNGSVIFQQMWVLLSLPEVIQSYLEVLRRLKQIWFLPVNVRPRTEIHHHPVGVVVGLAQVAAVQGKEWLVLFILDCEWKDERLRYMGLIFS